MRTESGLSQRALSRKLGLAETLVARIERGERTIDIIEFIDIAVATKIEPVTAFHRLLLKIEPESSKSPD